MTQYNIPPLLSRLRKTSAVRTLCQEHFINPQKLVQPLFINDNIENKKEISSMPGQFQLSISDLTQEILELKKLNITAVILFGIPKIKDSIGTSSFQSDGIIQKSIKIIKKIAPEMLVIADLCLCEYTDHGHCGILDTKTDNINLDLNKTNAAFAKQAVSLAKAGADWVAPSGMSDGMVASIRTALDKNGFNKTVILSYAVKYCSNLYGPFRQAAEGAPKLGNRKSYQMNPANANEAIREAKLDIEEGADIIMIKPAGLYADIIYRIKQTFPEIPLCAYQVSGEYSMIKLAGKNNILDANLVRNEALLSLVRSGADFIITYFAKEFSQEYYAHRHNS